MIWDDDDWHQLTRRVWRDLRTAPPWPRHIRTRWTSSPPRGKSVYRRLPRSHLWLGSEHRPHTHSLTDWTHTMRHARTLRTPRNAALALAGLIIAGSGLALGVGLPTPTPAAPAHSLTDPRPTASPGCEEDMPCWDCTINDDACADPYTRAAWEAWDVAGGEIDLELDPSRPYRVDYVASSEDYPENMDKYDLALVGKDGRWYVFRATYTDGI